MDILEIMKARHSVRQYSDKKITAMNQQKFYIILERGKVSARAGKGFYTKMDLGIVKYHFEAATGRKIE